MTRKASLLLSVCLSVLAFPAPWAGAQEIAVTSAIPAAAEQGTVNLNVSIKGKGFKRGAVARFLLSGTNNPDGIRVNSTTYLGPGELIANIDIADGASTSKFDIDVMLLDGRTGKGIELFSVLAKGSNPNACVIQPLPAVITAVGTLNNSGPAYANSLGQAVRGRLVRLAGDGINTQRRDVVIAAVGGNGRVEFFFLDPLSGAVLDGTAIGSVTQVQPHLTVPIPPRADGAVGGTREIAAGEVNGDGIPDFGAASYNSSMVHVFVSTNNNGVISYTSYPLQPAEGHWQYGWGVALGDLDGQPGDEAAAGAPAGTARSDGPGKVFLFKWNGTGFTNYQTLIDPLPKPKSATGSNGFGKKVAIADVTGSPALDLIVGANVANKVLVYPGSISPTAYLVFGGTDAFGYQVAAGNVDGGSQDMVVTTNASGSATRAEIYAGLITSGYPATFNRMPDQNLDEGWATTSPDLADVNGDGLDEMFVGAPNAACGGAAYLWMSSSGAPLANRLMLRAPVLDSDFQAFGWGTAVVPGTRLLLVSDHALNINGVTGAGQVYVYRLN